jgi:antitoxin component of MazEF toxin-antitoxin module
LALARVRRIGGRLVVTIPRKAAEEEGVKSGDVVTIEVRKAKKSFFGSDRGVGPFTADDEMTDHESVSLKRARVALILTPARRRDYLSKTRELIETPPKRTGKPGNWKPSKMKKIWKTREG